MGGSKRGIVIGASAKLLAFFENYERACMFRELHLNLFLFRAMGTDVSSRDMLKPQKESEKDGLDGPH